MLFLFAQKFLDCVLSSVKDSCSDSVRRSEMASKRLVVYETDEAVMEGGKIARKCEKLSVAERLEIALGCLK